MHLYDTNGTFSKILKRCFAAKGELASFKTQSSPTK